MQAGADVAVVGAGIVGLATAYALRRRGATVAVYDRGLPGAGQSGGDSRIFRHAHEDRRLVEWARESRSIYRRWEEELGAEMVSGDAARMPLLHGRVAFAVRDAAPARVACLTDTTGLCGGVGVWEADSTLFLAGNNPFKHAPALGQALAEAALGGAFHEELRPAARLDAASA